MKNITLSINDDLLKAARDYAKTHNISLNKLLRDYLKKTVINDSSDWLDECFKKMDELKLNSNNGMFNRKEIYDV